ncbi:uncharacterized protein BJX67DRAFT_341176 [Aspergillus lucknowensis]|uniref:Uncharacterized protein n=1 Tax=Aspergillus lucknowensis TaxID=176173 RepID=A0ABR4M5X9_9EURO
MRANHPSTPTLSLIHTSFQPRRHGNIADGDYLSATSTSPLSSTSTITLPSSPTSPSTSPSVFQFQHIRTPRPIHDSTKAGTSNANSHSHNHAQQNNLFLRRRPSNVDTLLRQERVRCTSDAIERQGLDLLEPRPVDLDPIETGVGIDTRVQQSWAPIHTRDITRLDSGVDGQIRPSSESAGSNVLRHSQPRFVLGGIFEVMEGRG